MEDVIYSAIVNENIPDLMESLQRFPIHQKINNKTLLEWAFLHNKKESMRFLLLKKAKIPLRIYEGDDDEVYELSYNFIRSENYNKLVSILLDHDISYESIFQMATLSICENNELLFIFFIQFIKPIDYIKLYNRASFCCSNHLILIMLVKKCGKDNITEMISSALEFYNLFLFEIIYEIYGDYITEQHISYIFNNQYIEVKDVLLKTNTSNFNDLFNSFIQILPINTILYRGTCQYRSIKGYWFSPSLECAYSYGIEARDPDLLEDTSIIAKYRTVKELKILNIEPEFIQIIPFLNDPKVQELFLNTMKICKNPQHVCRTSIIRTDEQLSNFLCTKKIDGLSYLNWIAEDQNGNEFEWSDEYRICSPETSLELVKLWSTTDLHTEYDTVREVLRHT